MEVEIRSLTNNPLLGRFDVELTVSHDGEATPSEEDLVSRFAAEEDLDEEDIEVHGIYTGFGSNKAKAELKVYGELEREVEEESEDTGEEEMESDESSGSSEEADYDEIVSGTISEAKEELEEMEDPDYEAALEAEKENKDRKTFKEWLENQQA